MARREAAVSIGLALAAIAGSIALAARYVLEAAPGNDAALRGMPLDDAYIHLVYARALAEDGGFFYNPGQAETGATSPLWAVLLSPLFLLKRFGFDLPTVECVKGLCVSVSALQAFAGGLLARRLTGSTWAAFAAVTLLVSEPMLVFASVSGMELALAGSLTLLGLLALASGRTYGAACALGLAALARPELALVSLLVPLAWGSGRLARSPGDTGEKPSHETSLGAYAVQAILVAGPFLLWVVVCLWTTGRPLPSTFYAKHASSGWLEHLSDLPRTLDALRTDVATVAYGLGALPFAVGVWTLGRRPQRYGPWLAWGFALIPIVLFVGVVWAHVLLQPRSFYWERYWLIVAPQVVVWAVVGLHTIVTWTRTIDSTPARALAWGFVGIHAAIALVSFATLLPAKARLYAWNCENIREAQVTIGRWVATHIPAGRTLATVDAGAVRFYSHRRTVDLMGLNAHRVLAEGAMPVLRRERPFAFVVFPALFPGIMNDPNLETVFETHSRNYTICDCVQDHMVVRALRATERTPSTMP